MKVWTCILALAVAVSSTPLIASAHAASGFLKGSFKYKNPDTGVEQPLSSGFIYLRDSSKPPPMEKFNSKADYILGPTSAYPFTVSVPEGSYYIRLLQRKTLGAVSRPYGPPEAGDYTWVQRLPITIRAGATLDLGTVYALPYSPVPVTIKGIVKSPSGVPVAGRYVRAQTEPCTTDGYNDDVNQCGPDKFPALQKTDDNGNYVIFLQNAGSYYIYTSPCLTADYSEYTGNRCGAELAPGPVTVKHGEVRSLDIVLSH